MPATQKRSPYGGLSHHTCTRRSELAPCDNQLRHEYHQERWKQDQHEMAAHVVEFDTIFREQRSHGQCDDLGMVLNIKKGIEELVPALGCTEQKRGGSGRAQQRQHDIAKRAKPAAAVQVSSGKYILRQLCQGNKEDRRGKRQPQARVGNN